MHNGPFGKRRNSIAVFRAQEAGTQEQSVVSKHIYSKLLH
jgi:hypothetical protein